MADSDSESEQFEAPTGTKRAVQRWSAEETQQLAQLVAQQQAQNGDKVEICWALIAKQLPNRTGKQCRHRWINSCQPNTKRGVWDLDEEHIVAQLHAVHGSSWSLIASKLQGRSENSVKNHFNALLRSKYLDSKKDSVLANYVRLLREGQQQSQATYEAALALTQQHREEAMNIIAKQVHAIKEEMAANAAGGPAYAPRAAPAAPAATTHSGGASAAGSGTGANHDAAGITPTHGGGGVDMVQNPSDAMRVYQSRGGMGIHMTGSEQEMDADVRNMLAELMSDGSPRWPPAPSGTAGAAAMADTRAAHARIGSGRSGTPLGRAASLPHAMEHPGNADMPMHGHMGGNDINSSAMQGGNAGWLSGQQGSMPAWMAGADAIGIGLGRASGPYGGVAPHLNNAISAPGAASSAGPPPPTAPDAEGGAEHALRASAAPMKFEPGMRGAPRAPAGAGRATAHRRFSMVTTSEMMSMQMRMGAMHMGGGGGMQHPMQPMSAMGAPGPMQAAQMLAAPASGDRPRAVRRRSAYGALYDSGTEGAAREGMVGGAEGASGDGDDDALWNQFLTEMIPPSGIAQRVGSKRASQDFSSHRLFTQQVLQQTPSQGGEQQGPGSFGPNDSGPSAPYGVAWGRGRDAVFLPPGWVDPTTMAGGMAGDGTHADLGMLDDASMPIFAPQAPRAPRRLAAAAVAAAGGAAMGPGSATDTAAGMPPRLPRRRYSAAPYVSYPSGPSLAVIKDEPDTDMEAALAPHASQPVPGHMHTVTTGDQPTPWVTNNRSMQPATGPGFNMGAPGSASEALPRRGRRRSAEPLLIPLGSGNRPNGPYAPPHHAPFAANAAAAGNAYFDAMRTADWSTPPSTQDDSVPPSAVVVSGQSHQSAMARQASLSPSVGGGSNGHGNGHGVVGAHAGHHGGPPLVFTSRGLGEDAISHHLEQLERISGAQQSDGSGGGSGDANRPTSPWDAVAAAAAAVARGVADLDLSAATPPAHPTATTHTNTTGNTDTSTAAAAAAALHTALGAAVGDDHAHADIFAGLHSGELLTFEDIDLSLLLQDDTHSDHA